jgi:hypothetical protein
MMLRFAESGFEPVEVDGQFVHPMLRLDPKPGDRLEIRWVSANAPRIQGLGVRLRRPGVSGKEGYGGVLRVAEVESPAIMLWMDTAPSSFAVECVKVVEGAQVQVSNRWRLDDGREDEWLNNFGMLVEEIGPESFVLHCSDGCGEAPTFDDLVVQVQLVRA